MKYGLYSVIALLLLLFLLAFTVHSEDPSPTVTASKSHPALTVTTVQPELRDFQKVLLANGSVAAWQEAIIGAEIGGLRIAELNAQVGQTVKKGQVLAQFADDSVKADIDQSEAAVQEAEANLAEAVSNAERARFVSPSGALSKQQIMQYETSEKTAKAKLASAKAQLTSQRLRLRYTRVVAIDDGVISARSATLGGVAVAGQELFRLIRQNRLEWRAEVTAAEMAQLTIGQTVTVTIPNVANLTGNIRQLAPTMDTQERKGLVYVDLPGATEHGIRAGMFAQGEFESGKQTAFSVPQEAVLLRDGYSYVFRLSDFKQELAKVSQIKVELGQQSNGAFQILSGVDPGDKLVASGDAFLADGDTVRVVKP
jgi:RND family efflux transporter MFP subunit